MNEFALGTFALSWFQMSEINREEIPMKWLHFLKRCYVTTVNCTKHINVLKLQFQTNVKADNFATHLWLKLSIIQKEILPSHESWLDNTFKWCWNFCLCALTQGTVISTSMVEGDDIIRDGPVPGERSKAVCSAAHGGCERNPYPSWDRQTGQEKYTLMLILSDVSSTEDRSISPWG